MKILAKLKTVSREIKNRINEMTDRELSQLASAMVILALLLIMIGIAKLLVWALLFIAIAVLTVDMAEKI